MNLDIFVPSFTDELIKIAQQVQPQQQQEGIHESARQIGRGALGFLAPGAASTAALVATRKGMDSASRAEGLNPGERHGAIARRVRSVGKAMGHEAPHDVVIGNLGPGWAPELNVPGGGQLQGSHLPPGNVVMPHRGAAPAKSAILVQRNTPEAVLAHEYGHAKFHHNNRLIGKARSISSIAANPLSSSIAGAVAAGEEDPSWGVGAANLAMHSPTLLDEGVATGHALRHMTKTHGFRQGLAKSRMLAPAYGTYAALAAAPLAITGARKWMKGRREKAQAQG
jgi:hypothetical protein